MKYLLIPVLSLLIVSEALAQGFNVFNNRNHPHLNWQVAETDHFEIIYPDRISGIEAEAAAIAEESYHALSENMNVEFSKRIRIYLADTDDIANGFANPIGKGYTMIWVNLNDFGVNRTGRVKWLRHVIAHELAHIFHFKAVWSNMGLLNYALGSPTPMFWTEGIAQYQTEEWNSQRGDRWLRKAIFDSRPAFNRGESIEDGRLMYAVGNSQLRYFTETRGDSTLADMLAHRNKRLGLFEYHDFFEAFDEYVDGGYREFYEEWRKHMNIYYNTLASQMERVDSLNADALSLPGRFYIDAAVSPGDSLLAVLSLQSMARPVRNLHIVKNDSTLKARKVAEGGIRPDLAWSRNGKKVYYSRMVRGEQSALLNDIFELDVETGRETRITHSRRATFPVPGPNNTIGYIVNKNGTGNVYTLDLETGEERKRTKFTGDVQVAWLTYSNGAWFFQIFKEDGERNIYSVSDASNIDDEIFILAHHVRINVPEENDDRNFIFSPDGRKMAYTSLRDEVPNVFVYDLDTLEEWRATNLFTGGEVFGWMAQTDTLETEKLLIKASETKRRDELFWVDANRVAEEKGSEVPPQYASWRQKGPPNTIPIVIEPDESLINKRYPYSSVSNITHVASFALPYFLATDNWGLFATTNWTEPLGKHLISAVGWISVADPKKHTYGALNYMNNQFYPNALFSLYRVPGKSKFYGNRFLIQELTGGEVSIRWPIDRFDKPYQSSFFNSRFRSIDINPINSDRYEPSFSIPVPVRGHQTDLTLEWTLKKQKPWRDNTIHPLDGYGFKLGLQGASDAVASDVEFLLADLNAFAVLPGPGLQRIYLQARYQHQWGRQLPQNYIGFSRFDNISVSLPEQVFLQLFQDTERVRGYREFVSGKRVLFGTFEYRMPFLPSLNTNLLNILRLGSTSLTLFSDAGLLWELLLEDENQNRIERWGAGAEVKNELSIFGIRLSHALGVAQPVNKLFEDNDVDIYYRFRAVVPF